MKHYKLNADEQRKVHITSASYELRARFSYNLKVFSIDNVKQILFAHYNWTMRANEAVVKQINTYKQWVVILSKEWKRERYGNFSWASVVITGNNFITFAFSKRIKILKFPCLQNANVIPTEKQKR